MATGSPRLGASPLSRFQQSARQHRSPSHAVAMASDAPLSGMRAVPAHLPWHLSTPLAMQQQLALQPPPAHVASSWASSPGIESSAAAPLLYARRPFAILTSPWSAQQSLAQQQQHNSALDSTQSLLQRTHSGHMAD